MRRDEGGRMKDESATPVPPSSSVLPPSGRSWETACLAGLVLAFAGVLVARNLTLFASPISEDGDPAANSFLILKAKRWELLHGHYSRADLFHPGSGSLYVLAWAEVLFHDLTGLVPAPHNAHVLGHLLLNAFLVSLSPALLGRAWGRPAASGWVCGALFLAWFAWGGQLASHWFAYLVVTTHLAFLSAAACV